jgi:hypothetical protein
MEQVQAVVLGEAHVGNQDRRPHGIEGLNGGLEAAGADGVVSAGSLQLDQPAEGRGIIVNDEN